MATSENNKLSTNYQIDFKLINRPHISIENACVLAQKMPLLDLIAHLSKFTQDQGFSYLASLAQKMKANMDQRDDHCDAKFSPLTTTACFFDPTFSPEALIENEDAEIQSRWKSSVLRKKRRASFNVLCWTTFHFSAGALCVSITTAVSTQWRLWNEETVVEWAQWNPQIAERPSTT